MAPSISSSRGEFFTATRDPAPISGGDADASGQIVQDNFRLPAALTNDVSEAHDATLLEAKRASPGAVVTGERADELFDWSKGYEIPS